ncbi:hypothetical protein [Microbacterium suwonense]|uniref:Uncharacterized protein n=1 Tax=Microbacterium suwonense TaxID=683047 RepID=A0ABM8FVB0_9MICO|nr:hypothetical protein [Microbacterium suwonense]BDZ39626.1 hypothetical protein GCM10025863_22400 [Microbacterium suwonense]
MTGTASWNGIVLPFDSLVLLASSAQGVAAIRNYGIAVGDFAGEFSELVDRLQRVGSEEAAVQLAVSRAIASDAMRADAWLSVRSEDGAVPPAIVLTAGDSVTVAVLHGAVVEYVAGGADLLADLVRGAADAGADPALRITVFDEDAPIADLRIVSGSVDVRSPDPERLERIRTAAESGLGQLVRTVMSESRSASAAVTGVDR